MKHSNELNHFKFTPSTWIFPSLLIMSIWAVYFIDLFFDLNLYTLGVFPRTLYGLKGIIFSPFLHGNFNHLANNTLPVFILSTALIYFYREVSLKVMVYGVLLSGIITWVIGRSSYHIGASSLIYVLFSFIFFKGLQSQYYRLIALSFAVVLIYGGMVWYVFPLPDIVGENSISWEGHLGGLISGFVLSTQLITPNYIKDTQFDWEKPDFNPDEDDFMKRFDENGNFVNPPKIELVDDEQINSSAITYVYHFIEDKESEK